MSNDKGNLRVFKRSFKNDVLQIWDFADLLLDLPSLCLTKMAVTPLYIAIVCTLNNTIIQDKLAYYKYCVMGI